ncbi:hypothetical protein ACJJTC_014277 [Scirpophaga incertulas]
MDPVDKVMSCGRGIDATKFGQYAFDTAQLYVNKYKWFYMPSSVHKVLIHGESVIRHFSVLPLGQLSEDAQESRNKDYKQFRVHHARKCSRAATNEDILHMNSNRMWCSKADIMQDLAKVTGRFDDVDEDCIAFGRKPPPVHRIEKDDNELEYIYGTKDITDNNNGETAPDLNGIMQMLKLVRTCG